LSIKRRLIGSGANAHSGSYRDFRRENDGEKISAIPSLVLKAIASKNVRHFSPQVKALFGNGPYLAWNNGILELWIAQVPSFHLFHDSNIPAPPGKSFGASDRGKTNLLH